jgi:DNA-directed RNA polymerase specialized sigma24 family protein
MERVVRRGATDIDGLVRLRNLKEVLEGTTYWLEEAVALARAKGRTWQEIGDALGISASAAHQRFSDRHP